MVKVKDEEQQSSGIGAILLVVVGVAVLVGLYAFARMLREESEEARELPLVSIMLDVNQFDAGTRVQVVELEKALENAGTFGKPFGPRDVKYLLPGAKPGDVPTAKGFAEMTDAEWEQAWKYLSITEYLVPRMFRLDGKSCVIRIDAKGGTREFAPDAVAKLEDALAPFRSKFKGVRLYSHTLPAGTTQDRDALNATYGCQLAWMIVYEPKSSGGEVPDWRTVAGVAKLAQARGVLSGDKHFRSVTTAADLVRYYWTVALQHEKQTDIPGSEDDVKKVFTFAKANQIHPLISQDGREAIVDTTVDVEGQQNAELYWYMAATLQQGLKVECKGYQPKIKTAPLKSDLPPDTPR